MPFKRYLKALHLQSSQVCDIILFLLERQFRHAGLASTIFSRHQTKEAPIQCLEPTAGTPGTTASGPPFKMPLSHFHDQQRTLTSKTTLLRQRVFSSTSLSFELSLALDFPATITRLEEHKHVES